MINMKNSPMMSIYARSSNYAHWYSALCRVYCVYATYQFPDYSKYMTLYFSETAKTRAREKQFPIDCHKAEALDTTLVNEACGG